MTLLTCPVCGLETHFLGVPHIRTHGFSSSQEFKERFGLVYLKSEEMRQKQSDFMHRSNPTEGRGHTQETIQKMCLARKGKGVGRSGKYERTKLIRQKISEGVARVWKDLTQKEIGKGEYAYSHKISSGRAWVRSSWEARLMAVLTLHPQVEWVTVEPFPIPYMFEGVHLKYWPDFLVELVGGIKELWEVKPEYKWWLPKNVAKRQALDDYVVQHQMNGCWVGGYDLRRMEMQVGLIPWEGRGTPWVDVSNPYHTPSVEHDHGI